MEKASLTFDESNDKETSGLWGGSELLPGEKKAYCTNGVIEVDDESDSVNCDSGVLSGELILTLKNDRSLRYGLEVELSGEKIVDDGPGYAAWVSCSDMKFHLGERITTES